MTLIPPKFLLLLLLLAFSISCNANQRSILRELIKSQKSYYNPLRAESWEVDETDKQPLSPVYIGPQAKLAESSRISSLPGQPAVGVDFNQYAGYVTVDPNHGRSLFYYFVESPRNASSKPLVLWLNGGPGCSSFGFGAMEELGPFRVNSDGKTLYRNEFAWNNVANVIFLESPAGVGFSYSNTSSDYITGDRKTADDAYTFLVNWLERYPQYKTRDLYLTGESYAGHYVPQLAYTIQFHNKRANKTIVNLKGIAIGNAYIDLKTTVKGTYDFYWTHAMNSDETSAAINKYCDFITGNFSSICNQYQNQGEDEVGLLDEYNIYAPVCRPGKSSGPTGSVTEFDPCSTLYVKSYLNLPEVQAALHAKATNWTHCGGKLQQWIDKPATVLPIIKNLMESGIRLWIFSGDIDAVVSVTTSRYAINTFNLPVVEKWRAWNLNGEVGGYVVGYKGLTFLTVRGAGHEVPSYKPERALTMISSFLQGTLPTLEDH